jgi:hypothetical protein
VSGSREEVVRRYASAAAENDLETLTRLRHPQWQVEWPQSGERVSSSEAFNAIVRAYPGGSPTTRIERVVGSEDRWVVTPSNTVVRMAGSGDFWWGDWTMTYPDGACYHCIDLIELRDGLVFRETVYWAPPFERPAWRAHLVDEPDPPGP